MRTTILPSAPHVAHSRVNPNPEPYVHARLRRRIGNGHRENRVVVVPPRRRRRDDPLAIDATWHVQQLIGIHVTEPPQSQRGVPGGREQRDGTVELGGERRYVPDRVQVSTQRREPGTAYEVPHDDVAVRGRRRHQHVVFALPVRNKHDFGHRTALREHPRRLRRPKRPRANLTVGTPPRLHTSGMRLNSPPTRLRTP